MEAVINDMLINKSHHESIYEFFEKVNMRTFDLLTNLIKEMNLFNEDAITCGMHLNLRSHAKQYEVFEIFKGKEFECYRTEFAPVSKIIEIERKEIDHLGVSDSKLRSLDIEDVEDSYDISYIVRIVLEDCKVERTGKNIHIETPEGLKFRFKEIDSKMSLVF
jgi:hypothetical protein